MLLHNGVWNWSLGDPEALSEPDVLHQTRTRLALTDAPWLSVHLGFSAAHVTFTDGMRPASAPLTRTALFATVVQNLRALQEVVSAPILIENLDYNPTGAYEHMCEPEFIAEVLAATEVDLLLDLAHAQVSASRLGYEMRAYLAELPLERIRQLHVSGPRPIGDTLADAHELLRDEDYALLADLLSETTPSVVTLEYGKDEVALQEQLAKLRLLVTP